MKLPVSGTGTLKGKGGKSEADALSPAKSQKQHKPAVPQKAQGLLAWTADKHWDIPGQEHFGIRWCSYHLPASTKQPDKYAPLVNRGDVTFRWGRSLP